MINDMYCINCGKELPENARFCLYCGTKVNSIVEAKPQVSNEEILMNHFVNTIPFVYDKFEKEIEQEEKYNVLLGHRWGVIDLSGNEINCMSIKNISIYKVQ